MKFKILFSKISILILLLFLVFPQISNAQTELKNTEYITFIYINGSNDYNSDNRTKFKENFKKNVNKTHPIILKQLSGDKNIQSLLLKNGEYEINPTPIIFYWGDKSINEIKHIDNGLNIAKKFTPKMTQVVRSIFAHCLHDAIWIQKYQNMTPVINELHEVIKAEVEKGNKVILLGYSAGSFISYQYFLNKFPSPELKEIFEKSNDKDINLLTKNSNQKTTCLSALMKAQIVTLNANGQLNLNTDKNIILTNYPKMDTYTKNACFCNDDIKGIINFASPFILFYSDVVDNSTNLNKLSQLMLKYMIENDVFFLTVNYRNDPLGYPIEKNITFKETQHLKSLTGFDIKPNGGFFYTKSDVYVPRTFISAHLAYWDTPKRFAKGIINAYKKGYSHFYEK